MAEKKQENEVSLIRKIQRVLAGFPPGGPDARTPDAKRLRHAKRWEDWKATGFNRDFFKKKIGVKKAKGGLIKSSRKKSKSIDGIARKGHTRAKHR